MSENAEAAKLTPDHALPGHRLSGEQSSQWLKAMLPDMTNGWWNLYPKDMRFEFKFCWRDPDFKLSGANGFCGWCAGKLKIKALPLHPDGSLLAASKM